jgi:hypothetical protein
MVLIYKLFNFLHTLAHMFRMKVSLVSGHLVVTKLRQFVHDSVKVLASKT